MFLFGCGEFAGNFVLFVVMFVTWTAFDLVFRWWVRLWFCKFRL